MTEVLLVKLNDSEDFRCTWCGNWITGPVPAMDHAGEHLDMLKELLGIARLVMTVQDRVDEVE